MQVNLLMGYALLFLASLLFIYQGVPYLMEQWKRIQEKRAQQALSKFENMFIFLERKKVMAIFVFLPIVLAAATFLVTHNFLFAVIGFGIGAVLPFMYIKQLEAARKRKFSAQLIDALMIVSNSLKAGLSVVQAMEVLVEELSSPVKDEFSLVVREIHMGVSLEEAMQHLNQRMPSQDMDLITSAVLVAKETGGDLTKVFARLIDTIRERQKLKELVQTLTLQGRLQGIVMSLIPVVFVLFVLKYNPQHFDVMMQDELGKMLLMGAAVLQVIALFLIRKFSIVKV